jgi:hypothetical protein
MAGRVGAEPVVSVAGAAERVRRSGFVHIEASTFPDPPSPGALAALGSSVGVLVPEWAVLDGGRFRMRR